MSKQSKRTLDEVRETLEEYDSMQEQMTGINPNRGSDYKKTKGFYGEIINSSEKNVKNINKGIKAREIVVDNNGTADAITVYKNGGRGREIQDKMGYSYSDLKKIVTSSKYDGMVLRINRDHPVFINDRQYEELLILAKEHNIVIQRGSATKKETETIALCALVEGNIKKTIGLDNNGKVTTAVYTQSKKTKYLVEKVKDEPIDIATEYLEEKVEFIRDNSELGDELAHRGEIKAVFNHSVQYVMGNENISQASAGMVVDVVKYTVEKKVNEEIDKKINDGTLVVTQTFSNIMSDKQKQEAFNEFMGKMANAGEFAQIARDVAFIANTAQKLINKELTVEDFALDMCAMGANAGLEFVCGTAGATVGLYAGGAIGAVVGGLLGGPIGAIAGLDLGADIGWFVGELVGTLIGGALLGFVNSIPDYSEMYLQAKTELANKIDQGTLELATRLTVLHYEHEMNIQRSFSMMVDGVIDMNMNAINNGLDVIYKEFDIEEEFKTQDEFDEFMLDKKSSIKIARVK